MRRLALTLGGVLATAVLATGTVAAATPTTVETAFHRSVADFAACPGYAVHGEFDVTWRTTTFFDTSGQAVRFIRHVDAAGVLSDPLTGISLPDESHFTLTVDLVTGERTYTGDLRVDTAPGVGVVFQVAGRVDFEPDGSVIEAGPHDDLDGNLGPLCAYLAGS